MGYMGFGMMKWVYNKRPRKVFSKRKKIQSFSALPKYYRRFKIQPSAQNPSTTTSLGIFVLIVFSATIMIIIPKMISYEHKRQERIIAYNEARDESTFEFLLKSGKARLVRGQVEPAYSDLILAHRLNPDDENVNQLIIETLSILCESDNSFCSDLDRFLYESL